MKLENILLAILLPIVGAIFLMSTIFAWSWIDFWWTYGTLFVVCFILLLSGVFLIQSDRRPEIGKTYIVRHKGRLTYAVYQKNYWIVSNELKEIDISKDDINKIVDVWEIKTFYDLEQ